MSSQFLLENAVGNSAKGFTKVKFHFEILFSPRQSTAPSGCAVRLNFKMKHARLEMTSRLSKNQVAPVRSGDSG
ncbi:hypothetical protein llap_4128 [Limosa lapponica baueri]|uniref:Uncharacterized protein n=1 Tax=Limosa lapponica baueri TaxID=1758121 RepID=A0A2I0UHN1_LIMLA|nr:hypothetical protein llap_4128 [Limosa lapponica baueri]